MTLDLKDVNDAAPGGFATEGFEHLHRFNTSSLTMMEPFYGILCILDFSLCFDRCFNRLTYFE